MQLGAARIKVHVSKPKRVLVRSIGYARVNGIHFDLISFILCGVGVDIMRLRDNDYDFPICHAGYRADDRMANPNLPSYSRYF